MDPSTTIKFLLPFYLTPITLETKTVVFPTSERPGSMMSLRFIWIIVSLISPNRSLGLGISDYPFRL